MTVLLKNTLLQNTKLSFYDPSFDVTSVPGCTLYLPSGDYEPNGEIAETWYDRSGNGFDISNLNAIEQPKIIKNSLNGKDVLRFNGNVLDPLGTNSLARNAVKGSDLFSANECTIFAVNKQDAVADNRLLYWTKPTQTTSVGVHNPYGDEVIYWDAPNSSVIPSARVSLAGQGGKIGWASWAFVKESAVSSRVYYQGSSLFSGSYSPAPIPLDDDTFSLYVPIAYKGEIAEIIIYNRVLTQVEINLVFNYLINKFSLLL